MFLEKLQAQPDGVKKIIIWSAVAAIGAVLFFFYFKNFKKNLEEFNVQKIKEKIQSPPDFPEIKIPEINMREIMEEIKNATGTKTE